MPDPLPALFPGIHTNLIAVLVISSSAFLLNYFSPLVIAIFIISMSITNTFLDAIPSIFLGAPDPAMSLSVLPGHKMLMEGKGFEAVILTLIGSSVSLVVAIISFPFVYKLIINGYPLIKDYLSLILIVIVLIFILREEKNKIWALILFLSAGILGIASFSLNSENILFPLLSGLFGTSTLITSLNQKTKIPTQKETYPSIGRRLKLKIFSSILISSLFTTTLPGLGAAQAAAIGSAIFKNIKDKFFLVLVGGINTSSMVLSIFTLYAIERARNGSIVAISKIIPSLSMNNLIILVSASLIAASAAIILTIKSTKKISNIFPRINYNLLAISVILFISFLVFLLSGNFLGLLILITSTFLGIIPQIKGIRRSHLMGCIILPVILYFI